MAPATFADDYKKTHGGMPPGWEDIALASLTALRTHVSDNSDLNLMLLSKEMFNVLGLSRTVANADDTGAAAAFGVDPYFSRIYTIPYLGGGGGGGGGPQTEFLVGHHPCSSFYAPQLAYWSYKLIAFSLRRVVPRSRAAELLAGFLDLAAATAQTRAIGAAFQTVGAMVESVAIRATKSNRSAVRALLAVAGVAAGAIYLRLMQQANGGAYMKHMLYHAGVARRKSMNGETLTVLEFAALTFCRASGAVHFTLRVGLEGAPSPAFANEFPGLVTGDAYVQTGVAVSARFALIYPALIDKHLTGGHAAAGLASTFYKLTAASVMVRNDFVAFLGKGFNVLAVDPELPCQIQFAARSLIDAPGSVDAIRTTLLLDSFNGRITTGAAKAAAGKTAALMHLSLGDVTWEAAAAALLARGTFSIRVRTDDPSRLSFERRSLTPVLAATLREALTDDPVLAGKVTTGAAYAACGSTTELMHLSLGDDVTWEAAAAALLARGTFSIRARTDDASRLSFERGSLTPALVAALRKALEEDPVLEGNVTTGAAGAAGGRSRGRSYKKASESTWDDIE